MHSCPDCGQACYCEGDLDDCEVDQDAEEKCTHCLEGDGGAEDEEDFDGPHGHDDE